LTRRAVYQGSPQDKGWYRPMDWLPEEPNWSGFWDAPSSLGKENHGALQDIDGDHFRNVLQHNDTFCHSEHTWNIQVHNGHAHIGDDCPILTLYNKSPLLVILRFSTNMLAIFSPNISPNNSARSHVKCLIFLYHINPIWIFST
jgi:hypothetical protein